MSDKRDKKQLLFELEYQYIETTIHQAIEDRYKMLNFYIALSTAVGSVMVGIFAIGEGELTTNMYLLSAILALMVSITGWVFVSIMVRLREAWYESVLALNHLKRNYIDSDSTLEKLTPWDSHSVPKKHRRWNIHFYASGLIIALNSLFLSMSWAFWFYPKLDNLLLIIVIAAIIFAISASVQLALYTRQLTS